MEERAEYTHLKNLAFPKLPFHEIQQGTRRRGETPTSILSKLKSSTTELAATIALQNKVELQQNILIMVDMGRGEPSILSVICYWASRFQPNDYTFAKNRISIHLFSEYVVVNKTNNLLQL